MKKICLAAAFLLIAGCTFAQSAEPAANDGSPMDLETKPAAEEAPMGAAYADLPDLGTAPELEMEVWLNTDQPLRLADLRGKVVLLDMWTFG